MYDFVGYTRVQSHIQEEWVMGHVTNWIGIDDHADSWTIAQFTAEGSEPAREWELVPTESGYRKLIGWIKGMPGEVRVVYEAGPCGYELYRRLRKSKIACEVAAPSLTPRKPGDRVKTNRGDACKLARLYRARELTLIAVPDEHREAARDLVRARQATSKDLHRAQHQLSKLLLRYGHRYRNGKSWTQRHWNWIRAIKLSECSQMVVDETIVSVEQKLAQLARYDKVIESLSKEKEFAPWVEALVVLRGISTLTAMIIVTELGDLRRFGKPTQLMAAIGLVPSEYSTGDHTRRYGITKTGNAHVRHVAVEASWHYQKRASSGAKVQARRKGKPQVLVDIATKCELRLNRRFNRLTSRGKRSTVAAVAVARELAGFIWAIGQQVHQ